MNAASWIQRKLWDFAVGVVLLAFIALACGWIDGAGWIDLAKWFGGFIAAASGVPATAGAVTKALQSAKEST